MVSQLIPGSAFQIFVPYSVPYTTLPVEHNTHVYVIDELVRHLTYISHPFESLYMCISFASPK